MGPSPRNQCLTVGLITPCGEQFMFTVPELQVPCFQLALKFWGVGSRVCLYGEKEQTFSWERPGDGAHCWVAMTKEVPGYKRKKKSV